MVYMVYSTIGHIFTVLYQAIHVGITKSTSTEFSPPFGLVLFQHSNEKLAPITRVKPVLNDHILEKQGDLLRLASIGPV